MEETRFEWTLFPFNTSRQWITLLAGFIIWFSTGIALAWSSVSYYHLIMQFHLTYYEIAWIVAILFLGIIVGVVLNLCLYNLIGPKILLFTFSLLGVASWLIIMFLDNNEALLGARFIYGIWIGTVFSVLEDYLEDTTTLFSKVKAWLPVMTYWGVFFVNLIGYFSEYQYVTVGCLVVSLLISFLILLSPESPHYYLSKGQNEVAREMFLQLHGGYAVDVIAKVEEEMKEKEEADGSIMDILSEKSGRRVFVMFTVICILEHLTGLTIFLIYASVTFKNFRNTEIVLVLTGVWVLLASICVPIVPRMKRKHGLLTAFIGSALSIFVSFLWYKMTDKWLLYAPFVLHAFFYFFGIHGMTKILQRELLEEKSRRHVRMISEILSALTVAIASKAFLLAAEVNMVEKYFLVICVFSVVGLVFVYFFMVESKDLTPLKVKQIIDSGKKDSDDV